MERRDWNIPFSSAYYFEFWGCCFS